MTDYHAYDNFYDDGEYIVQGSFFFSTKWPVFKWTSLVLYLS